MRLKFHTLDVFTDKRFGGNPLAVVLDADGLDTDRMQTIAREFNLSETVFVLRPQNPMHSACVRIFTPAAELPFAGHPTVGAAALLAELRGPDPGANHEAIVVLEETIGTVRVGVRFRPGQAVYAEFDAPKLPEKLEGELVLDDVAAAVGLQPTEIGLENYKPSLWSAGVPGAFIPVRNLAAISRARPVMSQWERAFGKITGSYLYCRETLHTTSHFHARKFAPGHGVLEDPATGSAAAAFAAVVHCFDNLPSGEHRYKIEQGYEMGRPSTIDLTISVQGSHVHSVRIGGHAVRVSDGEIEV